MANVPADLLSTCSEILQAGPGSYDPGRLRSIFAPDFDFDGPIAGRVRGADRFSRAGAGFIATEHGVRFPHKVTAPDAAAVLYERTCRAARSGSPSSSVSTAGTSPRSNGCMTPPGTPSSAGVETRTDTVGR